MVCSSKPEKVQSKNLKNRIVSKSRKCGKGAFDENHFIPEVRGKVLSVGNRYFVLDFP